MNGWRSSLWAFAVGLDAQDKIEWLDLQMRSRRQPNFSARVGFAATLHGNVLMIRATLLIGMAVTLGPTSARADNPETPSAVDQAFGNTILSTYPDGRKAELWLQPGGTYTGEGRRHDPSSGHWSVNDKRICLKQSRPFWTPFVYCTALPSGVVGSSWSARAVTGEQIRVTLVKGHIAAIAQAAP